MARRQAAGNVLEPLLVRRQTQSRKRAGARRRQPKLPTKPLEDLEPWEEAELRYLKDLQASAFKKSFGTELLDYFHRHQIPSELEAGGSKPADEEQLTSVAEEVAAQQAAASEAAEPSQQKVDRSKLSVLEAAMAMPLPPEEPLRRAVSEHVSRTPKSPRSPWSPIGRTLSAPSSPSRVVAPLTLPGMKTVPPAGNEMGSPAKLQQASTPSTPKKSAASGQRRESEEEDSMGASLSLKMWQGLSPFLKFRAKKPRDGQGVRCGDELEEMLMAGKEGDHHGRSFGFGHHNSEEPTEMHAKTAGMVGGLRDWLNSGKGGTKGQEGGMPVRGAMAEDLSSNADKAEYRILIGLAKKYSLPVNEVRDIKNEFNDHDKDGAGHITREEFLALIRKRTNLPEEEEIPFHLLKGVSQAGGRIGFEEFLRWSILTAWSEEMMMPSRDEREIRQLAREQEMALPDVEKVKRLFDEFDTDGSGEIEEEEFRHILYKMLHVRDVTDVPLKRLQRYWREVDLDGSGSIGFNEFLIWYKTSFAKDGRVDHI